MAAQNIKRINEIILIIILRRPCRLKSQTEAYHHHIFSLCFQVRKSSLLSMKRIMAMIAIAYMTKMAIIINIDRVLKFAIKVLIWYNEYN